jgi:hypothetical protein
VSIDTGLPFSYVSAGPAEPGQLAPADPDTLVAGLVS